LRYWTIFALRCTRLPIFRGSRAEIMRFNALIRGGRRQAA
jgi:hypothetical protein